MSTINNSQISTKDNMITSSATGLLAGAGFALAGYNSRPYLKDGVISDTFVQNVENNLASKLPGGSQNKKILESLNKFVDEIGKATSYSKIADANYDFYNKISPDKSFNGIKEIIKQSIESMIHIIGAPESYMTDIMLDYYSAVRDAKNPNELKSSILYYYKDFGAQFDSFGELKSALKETFNANKNLVLGLDSNMAVKDAVEVSFDWNSGKFVHKPNNGISKDLFNVINDTARNMQWKTAGLWGGLGAAIFGGAMFLIQKFSSRKSKPMNVHKQSQINPRTKTNSQAQNQSQQTVSQQPKVPPEVQGNSQYKVSTQPQPQTQSQQQQSVKFEIKPEPQEKNNEQLKSTNLLENYKKAKN